MHLNFIQSLYFIILNNCKSNHDLPLRPIHKAIGPSKPYPFLLPPLLIPTFNCLHQPQIYLDVTSIEPIPTRGSSCMMKRLFLFMNVYTQSFVSSLSCIHNTNHNKQQPYPKQGMRHTMASPCSLKSILRQKKIYGNSNISPCKKCNLKKFSKRNQNPSRYYESVINLKFQHKPKYHLSKIHI